MKLLVFLLCLLPLLLCGQDSVPATRRYADMHMHATLKNYYNFTQKGWNNPTYNSLTNWREWPKINIDAKNAGKNSGFKNYFQATYNEVIKNERPFSIIFNSFTPLEKTNVEGPKIFLAKLATRLSFRRLLTLRNTSGYNDLKGEYKFTISQSTHFGTNYIVPVRDSADLAACIVNNKTALILNIEGGQALYGNANSNDMEAGTPFIRKKEFNKLPPREFNRIFWVDEMLKNLDSLQNPAVTQYKIFSLNLSHLSWLRTAGGAKSLDKRDYRWLLGRLSVSKKFRAWVYYKVADGFLDGENAEGGECGCGDKFKYKYCVEVTRLLLDKMLLIDNNHEPNRRKILPDIKHMDIRSRMQYYQYLDNLSVKGVNIPIICSHGAASGENLGWAKYSGLCPNYDRFSEIDNPKAQYKQWMQNSKTKKCVPDSLPRDAGKFYPISINLYDEEIEKIYKSKGIIGVILEQRALGAEMPFYDSKEHHNEVEDFLINNRYDMNKYTVKEYVSVEPILRNMLYMIEKTKDTIPERAWKLICVGSDMDGGIDPIDICPAVDSYYKLEILIRKYLSLFAAVENKQKLLIKKNDGNDDIDKMMDMFFEQNLLDFTKNNF